MGVKSSIMYTHIHYIIVIFHFVTQYEMKLEQTHLCVKETN